MRDAHDIEAVADVLRTQGIVYTRGTALLDSGDVDPKTMAKIDALPPREPFTLPLPGKFVAAVIVARAPLATAQQRERRTACDTAQQGVHHISERLRAASGGEGARREEMTGSPFARPGGRLQRLPRFRYLRVGAESSDLVRWPAIFTPPRKRGLLRRRRR